MTVVVINEKESREVSLVHKTPIDLSRSFPYVCSPSAQRPCRALKYVHAAAVSYGRPASALMDGAGCRSMLLWFRHGGLALALGGGRVLVTVDGKRG